MRSLSEYHPAVTALYFFALAVLLAVIRHPVLTLIGFVGSVVLFFLEAGAAKKRIHFFALAVVLVASILNPLVSHHGSTVLFVVNDRPFTLEALLYGVFSAVLLAAVIYLFAVFSKIMTEDKLFCIFGLFSPKLALVFCMALRYIPILGKDAVGIDRAQREAGFCVADNLIDKIRAKLRVFSALTTGALENGAVTADTMASRGYGVARRRSFSFFRFTKRDAILLAVILLLAGGVVFCALRGALHYDFYPLTESVDLSGLSVVGYVLFALLAALPSALCILEKIKWNCLTSKI